MKTSRGGRKLVGVGKEVEGSEEASEVGKGEDG